MMADVTVEQAAVGFDERRRLLLESMVPPDLTVEQVADPTVGLYGERALACLLLGRFTDTANAKLRRVAAWFEYPHPGGRDQKGENDFAAIKLCRTYYLLRDDPVLEPATMKRITDFFLTCDIESVYGSENHHLLFRTSRYLMGQALPDQMFAAYGRTGRELAEEDLRWLIEFIRYRARRGWGEFDSTCYFRPQWESLATLYDYAGDGELKRLAGMMLDMLLLDMAVDSLDGMYCGAHARIYTRHALDHAAEPTYPLQYLYFGNLDPETIRAEPLLDALVSTYRPQPLIVRIALERHDSYANRERKYLFDASDILQRSPLPGSIRKLTWYTPRYVLGAITLQDPYPPQSKAGWYAHHEQHEWDLTIASDTRSRIFTHHPGDAGNEHGYWTGDLRCVCGRFFQHNQVVLALYDIPDGQPYNFIHAYLPREAFEEVREEGGWIFVRKSGVLQH